MDKENIKALTERPIPFIVLFDQLYNQLPDTVNELQETVAYLATQKDAYLSAYGNLQKIDKEAEIVDLALKKAQRATVSWLTGEVKMGEIYSASPEPTYAKKGNKFNGRAYSEKTGRPAVDKSILSEKFGNTRIVTSSRIAEHQDIFRDMLVEMEHGFYDVMSKAKVLERIKKLTGTGTVKGKKELNEVVDEINRKLLDINMVVGRVLDEREHIHPDKYSNLLTNLKRLYQIIVERKDTWNEKTESQPALLK
jgi:hypothetical protein